jgi:hypothetical protein
VLLQLNVHYKTRVAVKFTGIPELSAEPQTTSGTVTSPDGDEA